MELERQENIFIIGHQVQLVHSRLVLADTPQIRLFFVACKIYATRSWFS